MSDHKIKKFYWVLTNKWDDFLGFYETRKAAMYWAKKYAWHENNATNLRAYKVKIVRVRP